MYFQHRIKSATIELEYENEVDAFSSQMSVKEFFATQIQPEMQRLFDSQDLENKVCRIEKVELNLGRIPIQNLETGLKDHILLHLEEWFRKQIFNHNVGQPSSLHVCSEDDKLYDLLTKYLKNGFLDQSVLAQGDLDGILQRVLLTKANRFRRFIVGNYSYPLIERIVYQFDSNNIFKLLTVLQPNMANGIIQGTNHIASDSNIDNFGKFVDVGGREDKTHRGNTALVKFFYNISHYRNILTDKYILQCQDHIFNGILPSEEDSICGFLKTHYDANSSSNYFPKRNSYSQEALSLDNVTHQDIDEPEHLELVDAVRQVFNQADSLLMKRYLHSDSELIQRILEAEITQFNHRQDIRTIWWQKLDTRDLEMLVGVFDKEKYYNVFRSKLHLLHQFLKQETKLCDKNLPSSQLDLILADGIYLYAANNHNNSGSFILIDILLCKLSVFYNIPITTLSWAWRAALALSKSKQPTDTNELPISNNPLEKSVRDSVLNKTRIDKNYHSIILAQKYIEIINYLFFDSSLSGSDMEAVQAAVMEVLSGLKHIPEGSVANIVVFNFSQYFHDGWTGSTNKYLKKIIRDDFVSSLNLAKDDLSALIEELSSFCPKDEIIRDDKTVNTGADGNQLQALTNELSSIDDTHGCDELLIRFLQLNSKNSDKNLSRFPVYSSLGKSIQIDQNRYDQLLSNSLNQPRNEKKDLFKRLTDEDNLSAVLCARASPDILHQYLCSLNKEQSGMIGELFDEFFVQLKGSAVFSFSGDTNKILVSRNYFIFHVLKEYKYIENKSVQRNSTTFRFLITEFSRSITRFWSEVPQQAITALLIDQYRGASDLEKPVLVDHRTNEVVKNKTTSRTGDLYNHKNPSNSHHSVSTDLLTADNVSGPCYNEEALDDDITESVIYVNNAGLILMAPFLPLLFERLSLIETNVFKSRQHAERACHLLQYINNDSCSSPETSLLLNKLLCGIKPGLPITRGINVENEERNTIHSLMEHIIKEWKAVGNTSFSGLQTSFFQRQGKLQLKDEIWLLTLEQRPYDMLIDQLPWSISNIKFSWMQRMINVYWR